MNFSKNKNPEPWKICLQKRHNSYSFACRKIYIPRRCINEKNNVANEGYESSELLWFGRGERLPLSLLPSKFENTQAAPL